MTQIEQIRPKAPPIRLFLIGIGKLSIIGKTSEISYGSRGFFDNKDWHRMAERTITAFQPQLFAITIFSIAEACSPRCIRVYTEAGRYRRQT